MNQRNSTFKNKNILKNTLFLSNPFSQITGSLPQGVKLIFRWSSSGATFILKQHSTEQATFTKCACGLTALKKN